MRVGRVVLEPCDTVDAVLWWRGLSEADRADVVAWLHRSPPPPELTRAEWAYLECPSGLFSGRYGRLI